ncbi:FliM/FliN family flagellar motor switch protein [Atlantibacter subterraneus]|uniref:FliM/FliN family flagellar motor switch protein n=1 Tax=Atlantibacter subterraneus TaxID=255519 RepID=UPI0028B1E07E|nr:FliM/FliN family flagellar motor switch protein [Atlantibacter subterranea]
MLKYSETAGIIRLEGNRLGRPYHRLPDVFNRKFDVIELRLGNWFLKKHRANIQLKNISFKMDVVNKSAELLASPIGDVGFDIDRSLLLTLLDNFYGMEISADDASNDSVLTKTEQRLKSRMAVEIISLLFNSESLNLPLPVKPNSNGIQTHWAWQAIFSLSDDASRTFSLLLDDAHTDYILNMLRKHDKHQAREGRPHDKTLSAESVAAAVSTLPLNLKIKVAELSLNVAMLTTLRPGDILPVSLPDAFPIYIGSAQLFTGMIVEEHDRLMLSDIKEIVAEKTYE